jgi:hypothetical protein
VIRRLDFEPLDWFSVAGDLRELKAPTGKPTPRQLSMLNELGCLLVVEPGQTERLDRRHAAGAIAAARRLAPK